MPRERFLDPAQVEALGRLRGEFAPLWHKRSPVLRVRFQGEGVAIDVRHQLGVVPTGFLVVNARLIVVAAPGKAWTPELAFLAVGSVPEIPGSEKQYEALVIFFVTEDPIDADTGQRA